MPKFKWGAPQVTFRKRNGSKFTKTYHSRSAAAKSVKAYRSAGGKVVGTGIFGVKKGSVLMSKSGRTTRSGRATRDTKNWKETW